jgi:hypothetical protein
MSLHHKLSAWLTLAVFAALAAMSLISVALAQVEGDGDGVDGDELSLPIIVGAVIVALVGWMIVRRRSHKFS